MGLNRVALIPARGGSKGLPDKNIRPFCGEPLIVWSIRAAEESRVVDRILVSTDDPAIAEIAAKAGAEVPGLRPAELATDDASSVDVARFVLEGLDESGSPASHLLLLQPTSPLRTGADLRESWAMIEGGAQAVVGVSEAADHPWLCFRCGADQALSPFVPQTGALPRRQEMPPAFALNGALYWIETQIFLRENTFMPPGTRGYVMPPTRSVDIDNLFDFELAEWLAHRADSL